MVSGIVQPTSHALMADVHEQPALKRRPQHGNCDVAASGASRIEAVQNSYAHPASVLLTIIYLAHHAGVLLHQTGLWLAGMRAGQVLTLAATVRLAFLVHEAASIRFAWWILRAAVYGTKAQDGADRALVLMAFLVPVFQHLIAINSIRAMPEQKWWGFNLLMVVLGVIAEFKPSHSLLQAICGGTLLT